MAKALASRFSFSKIRWLFHLITQQHSFCVQMTQNTGEQILSLKCPPLKIGCKKTMTSKDSSAIQYSGWIQTATFPPHPHPLNLFYQPLICLHLLVFLLVGDMWNHHIHHHQCHHSFRPCPSLPCCLFGCPGYFTSNVYKLDVCLLLLAL